jgi:putative ABC transport system permease protein
MSLLGIALRNLFRNKLRSTLTIVGVAIAVIAFVLLRTVLSSWNASVEYAAKDRIGTRHKVSFILSMPKRYVDQIRQTKGIAAVTWANWFGGKDPRYPSEFFATLAVDPDSYLKVYEEIQLPQTARETWLGDRQGAIVGDALAHRLGLKVGDRISLLSNIFRGTWTFNIDGIYTVSQPSVDRSQFLFHWDLFNKSLPDSQQDMVGWVVSRVDDPSLATDVSASIDRTFDSQDVQTLSMSEKSMNLSFMAGFTAILRAMNIVSLIILVILLLILGNTIAMGVRERRYEYGVLRALGFRPGHVALFVMSESIAMGFCAGLLGVGVAYPVVQYGLGRWIEENMNGLFSWFRIDPTVALISLALSVVLGTAAGAVPAWRAAKLTVVDALRRVD